jgi:hypothetical protein
LKGNTVNKHQPIEDFIVTQEKAEAVSVKAKRDAGQVCLFKELLAC